MIQIFVVPTQRQSSNLAEQFPVSMALYFELAFGIGRTDTFEVWYSLGLSFSSMGLGAVTGSMKLQAPSPTPPPPPPLPAGFSLLFVVPKPCTSDSDGGGCSMCLACGFAKELRRLPPAKALPAVAVCPAAAPGGGILW